jgi:hypothetical protein
VVNPCNISSRRAVVRTPLAASAKTSAAKLTKYDALCTAEGLNYAPLPLYTTGGLDTTSERPKALLDRLIAITRLHYGISAGQAVLRVVLPLLVASMRAVGRAFRARYDYGRLHHQALPPTPVLGVADDAPHSWLAKTPRCL